MVVSYRGARIGMVTFEMMTMIGMILMTQTTFECLSRSGINKEKRKQDSGDFFHGIHRFTRMALCAKAVGVHWGSVGFGPMLTITAK